MNNGTIDYSRFGTPEAAPETQGDGLTPFQGNDGLDPFNLTGKRDRVQQPEIDYNKFGEPEALPATETATEEKKKTGLEPLVSGLKWVVENTSSGLDLSSAAEEGIQKISNWVIDKVKDKKGFENTVAALQELNTKARLVKSIDQYYKPMQDMGISDPAAFLQQPVEEQAKWLNEKSAAYENQLKDLHNGKLPDSWENSNYVPTALKGAARLINTVLPDTHEQIKAIENNIAELNALRDKIIAPKIGANNKNPIVAGVQYSRLFSPGEYENFIQVLQQTAPEGTPLATPQEVDNYVNTLPQEKLATIIPEGKVFETKKKGIEMQLTATEDGMKETLNAYSKKNNVFQDAIGNIKKQVEAATTDAERRSLMTSAQQLVDDFVKDPDVIKFNTFQQQHTKLADQWSNLAAEFPGIYNNNALVNYSMDKYKSADWFHKFILGNTGLPGTLGPYGNMPVGAYGVIGQAKAGAVEFLGSLEKFKNTMAGVFDRSKAGQMYYKNYQLDEDLAVLNATPEEQQSQQVSEYTIPTDKKALAKVLGLPENELAYTAQPKYVMNWGGVPFAASRMAGSMIPLIMTSEGAGLALKGIGTAAGEISGVSALLRAAEALPAGAFEARVASTLRAPAYSKIAGNMGTIFASVYGEAHDNALRRGLDNHQADNYALASALGSSLLFSYAPPQRFAEAAAGVKSMSRNEMLDVINTLRTEAGSAPGMAQTMLRIGKNALTETAKQTLIMSADRLRQLKTDEMFNLPSDIPFMDDMMHTVVTNFVGTLPLGISGAIGQQHLLGKQSMFAAGNDPAAISAHYEKLIKSAPDDVAREVLSEEKNKVMSIANTMAGIIKGLPDRVTSTDGLPGRVLTTEEKIELANNVFNAQKLRSDARAAEGDQKNQLTGRALEFENSNRDILNGTAPTYIINGRAYSKEQFNSTFEEGSDLFKNPGAFKFEVYNDAEAETLARQNQDRAFLANGLVPEENPGPDVQARREQLTARQADLKEQVADLTKQLEQQRSENDDINAEETERTLTNTKGELKATEDLLKAQTTIQFPTDEQRQADIDAGRWITLTYKRAEDVPPAIKFRVNKVDNGYEITLPEREAYYRLSRNPGKAVAERRLNETQQTNIEGAQPVTTAETQPAGETVTPTAETPAEAATTTTERPAATLEQLSAIPYDQRSDAQHADYIRKKFVQEFGSRGVPDEQMQAATALLDARANRAMPDNPDAYYRRIEDIGSGQFQQGSERLQGEVQPQGATELLASGRYIIHALEKPNFSTAVHEMAHVFEDELSAIERQVISDWAGQRNFNPETDKFTSRTSEAFARGFERYLRDGSAPTEDLRNLFQKAADWLKTIYQRLKGSAIARNISPEVKQVFDNLFTPTEVQAPKITREQRTKNDAIFKELLTAIRPAPEGEGIAATSEPAATPGTTPAAPATEPPVTEVRGIVTSTAPAAGRQLAPDQPIGLQPLTAAEQAESAKVGAVIKDNFNAAPKWVSDRSITTVNNGVVVKGRYALVPVESIAPSHDPQTFATSEGYPLDAEGRNVNSTDYTNRETQRAVNAIAGNYNQSALDNVPVVTKDGVVVSGNNRAMSGQLAAINKTRDLYDRELQDRLGDETRASALHGATVSDYNHVQQGGTPQLVFIADEIPSYTPEYYRRFNQTDIKLPSATALAIQLGRTVPAKTINGIVSKISNHETISDFYNTPADTRAVFGALSAGETPVIPARSIPQYISDKGQVSATGKEFLESLLIGNLLSPESVSVLDAEGMRGYRAKVVRSMQELNELNTHKDFALGNTIDQAIELLNEHRTSSVKQTWEEFINQPTLVPNENRNVEAIIVAQALQENPTAFRKFISDYKHIADNVSDGGMFGEPETIPQKELLQKALNLSNEQLNAIEEIAGINTGLTGRPAEEVTADINQRPAEETPAAESLPRSENAAEQRVRAEQTEPIVAPVEETPAATTSARPSEGLNATELKAAIKERFPDADYPRESNGRITRNRDKLAEFYDNLVNPKPKRQSPRQRAAASRQAAPETPAAAPRVQQEAAVNPEEFTRVKATVQVSDSGEKVAPGESKVFRLNVDGNERFVQAQGRPGDRAWYEVQKIGNSWYSVGDAIGEDYNGAVDGLVRRYINEQNGNIKFQRPGTGSVEDVLAGARIIIENTGNIDDAISHVRNNWQDGWGTFPEQTLREYFSRMERPGEPGAATSEGSGTGTTPPEPPAGDTGAAPSEGQTTEVFKTRQADTARMREELDMPEYGRTPKKEEQLYAEASRLINDPDFSIDRLLNEARANELEGTRPLSDVQRVALNMYMASTNKELQRVSNAYNEALKGNDVEAQNLALMQRDSVLNAQRKAIQAADLLGTAAGRALRSIQKGTVWDDSETNWFAMWQRSVSHGEQISKEDQEFISQKQTEATAARKEYEQNVERQQEAESRKDVEKFVEDTSKQQEGKVTETPDSNKEKPKRVSRKTKKEQKKTEAAAAEAAKEKATPKTSEQIQQRKEELRKSIRDKLSKRRGNNTDNNIRFQTPENLEHLETLYDIQPEFAELAEMLVRESVLAGKPITGDGLAELLMNEFKADFPELTMRDVRDMVTGFGMYTQTSEQSAEGQQLNRIKSQLRLMDELEDELGKRNPDMRIVREKRLRIAALRRSIESFRTPEQIKAQLAAVRKRYATRRAELEDKIARRDFTPTQRREPLTYDEQTQAAADKYFETKNDFLLQMAKRQFEERTKARKVTGGIIETLRGIQPFQTIGDIPVFRQAASLVYKNPKLAAKAFLEGWDKSGAKGGKARYQQAMRQFKESDFGKLADKSGLAVRDIYSATDRERLYLETLNKDNWFTRIPVFGEKVYKPVTELSERAQVAYLNFVRQELFKSEVASLHAEGYTYETHPEEFKQAAHRINTATGYGELAKWMQGAEGPIGKVLYSGRYMSARLAPYNPWYWARLTPRQRKIQALDTIRFLGTASAILGLATPLIRSLGGDVDWDRNSTNFMRIKVRNNWYDIMGGVPAIFRTFDQFIEGRRTSAAGRESVISPFIYPYKGVVSGVAEPFLRGKMNPVIGAAWDLREGQDAAGNPISLLGNEDAGERSELYKLVTPLPVQDIIKSFKEYGLDWQTGLTTATGIVGIGTTQAYTDEDRAAQRSAVRKARREAKRRQRANN